MRDAAVWPPVPEAERDTFHETADTFLQVANGLVVADVPLERIAAAFLYADSRFTAFAVQAQGGDAEDARQWLSARFEEELREHMLQRLRQNGTVTAPDGQVPDAALDVLMSLNGMSTAARSDFLKLADRFVRPANDLIAEAGIGWAAAAMLHACTRFNAYVMQSRGLQAGVVDDEVVGDFRTAFSDLLGFHLGQSLIADRDT